MYRRTPSVTLALLLSGMGLAQNGTLEALFNIDTWLQELTTYLDVYEQGFRVVASSLAVLGFVASLIGVLARGSLGGMNDVFLRLFMVSALIALSPGITGLSIDTWRALREWSGGAMAESFEAGAEEMERLGNDAGILAFAMTGSASALLRNTSMASAQAAGQARAGTAVRLLNAAVIPVAMIGLIAHFIVLRAGVAILLACAWLPVSAGMLAFSPAQGGEWLGKVLGAVVSALLVTAFMPLIFKAAFDLTVVQPIAAVNAEFAELTDYFEPGAALEPPPRLAEIESQRQALLTEKGQLQEGLKPWQVIANAGPATRIQWINLRLAELNAEALAVRGSWTRQMLRSANDAYNAIANEVMRWMTRLLVLLVAAFMASGLTWWGARVATGLVGGVIGGRIGALALGGAAGLFGRGGRGVDGAARKPRSSEGQGNPSATRRNSDGGPSGGGGRSYNVPAGTSTATASGEQR